MKTGANEEEVSLHSWTAAFAELENTTVATMGGGGGIVP
jgi:hypothetical protein